MVKLSKIMECLSCDGTRLRRSVGGLWEIVHVLRTCKDNPHIRTFAYRIEFNSE